ncbi:MAG: bifunctional phosphopantothenoylcysteine decarboxylase/phosphopantothenate--cysteine ligase CoaBC [Methylococcales bacterium]|jgi:phosphopantothenoylcysteine decarboxylase / phosphopantothenate---cysteine ligase|nr:bifunctional phosphopantothenoylcysteine decarboxylase/phosphopantothenate--cysteine ligase CoaBC [Methylococcales bacterium]MBT7444178.1 bifunctional phosphopantothenoylcysteine decarboxylase/phosphopantothenate--cysteine ligase CoaBC [Methylococcales bacterium]
MSLQGKHILLGVSGGIAAYKSAELIRLLVKHGAQVRVVMTHSATQFITPLTLATLSQHPVGLDGEDLDEPMRHIDWARWADVVLLAPATAQRIALMAHGFASDLLSTLCLAAECPVVVCPAMNQAMWSNPATQANVARLEGYGVAIIGPEAGEQACGEIGAGRLLTLTEIVVQLTAHLNSAEQCLAGKKVMITAGPTIEAIDPVRFLSNHSSGKMGYALAQAAYSAGAEVTLVSGPVAMSAPAGVTLVSVHSAEQMFNAVQASVQQMDIFIGCAAVADYRPESVQSQKIKKSPEVMTIQLTPTIDILASLNDLPTKPFAVGFAAETQNIKDYALGKLEAKKCDLIMANHVGIEGTGFGSDDNAVTVLGHDLQIELPKQSKTMLARAMISIIADTYKQRKL